MSVFSYLHLRGVIVALVLGLVAGLSAVERLEPDGRLTLVVTLQASAIDRVQLFYDIGSGYNELDSVTRRLGAENAFESLRFPLPAEHIRALRLDPLDRPGRVVIQAARIVAGDKDDLIAEIPLQQIGPRHQVTALNPGVEGLEVLTSADANDPSLDLPVPSYSAPDHEGWATAVGIPAGATFVIAFLCAGIGWGPNRRNAIELLGSTLPGPRMTPRAHLALLGAGVFVTVLGAKLALIGASGSDLPFWDQWNGEGANLYRPYLEGRMTWHDLVVPHNEHRIVLTRLLALMLLELNGQWDALLQMTVNAMLHAALLAGIVIFVGQWLGSVARILLATAVAGFFSIPFAWENTLAGFQSQFYFLLLFSLVHLAGTAVTKPGSRASWIAQLAGVAALFAMASGVASPAAVVALVLLRTVRDRTRWKAELLIGGFNLLLFVIGWQMRGHNPAHAPLQATTVQQFAESLWYLLTWPSGVWIAAILSLLALAALLIRWWQSPSCLRAVLLAWAGWWMLQLVILAFGRGASNAVFAGRYLDLVAVGHLVVLAIWLDWINSESIRWRRISGGLLGAAWGVTVLCGLWMHTRPLIHQFLQVQPGINDRREAVVSDYVHNRSPSFFDRAPYTELPFPHAAALATYLDDPTLRAILPPSVRPVVALTPSQPPVGFRKQAVPPELANYRSLAWGTFPAIRETSAEFVSNPLHSRTGYLILRHSGTGGQLVMREGDRTRDATGPMSDRRWQSWIVPVSRNAVTLHATSEAGTWLAFTAPAEIGAASAKCRLLISRGVPVAIAGVLLLAALSMGPLPACARRQA